LVPKVEDCLFWPLIPTTSYPMWEIHLVQARPMADWASRVWEQLSKTSENKQNICVVWLSPNVGVKKS